LFEVDLDLGLRCDPRVEADEEKPGSWLHALLAKVEGRGVDYDLADTHVSAERLGRYPLVCLSAGDFMDVDDQQRLLEYVEAGGTLVVGPEMPYLNPALHPASVLGRRLAAPGVAPVGRGRLIWARPPELDTTLNSLLPAPQFWCAGPGLDLVVHRDGGRALLFAANPTAAPVETRLAFAGRRALRPAWGAAETLEGDGGVTVRLPEYSVRIWEVAGGGLGGQGD
jgi:beta-galactosidase